MAQANIKAVITAEDRASTVLKGFSNSVENAADQIGHAAKRAAQALAVAATAAAAFSIKSAAELQVTSKSFEVLIGNAETAHKVFADIKKFADTTPFQFPELAKSARTLLGYGISSEVVLERLKMLGDISAVTGADLDRLTVVFGQVNAAGRVMGQDVLQLVNNSIPVTNILTKKLGITAAELRTRIEEGAVSAQTFTEALEDVTKEGGFAFKGTDELAKTFNGRLSTLKDTIAEVGRNLIGVRVDPELGLVIQPGGVFDRLSKAVEWLNNNLPSLKDKMNVVGREIKDVILNDVLPQFRQWADNVMEVATVIGRFLTPKFEALWNSVREKLLPVLGRLWKEILLPLVPVIGVVLVTAIAAVVDGLNLLITVLVPVMNWLLDNKWAALALATAIMAVQTAMGIGPVVAAFNAAMAIAQASIAATTTAFNILKLSLTTPIVVPALIVAAAIASINSIKNAWDAVNDAQRAAANIGNDAKMIELQKLATDARKRGDTAAVNRYAGAIRALGGNAQGTDNWRGGPTWVGEQGPEIVNLPRGSQVIPNHEAGKMGGTVNITIQAGAFMGSQMEARKYATMIMDAYRDATSMRGVNGVPA